MANKVQGIKCHVAAKVVVTIVARDSDDQIVGYTVDVRDLHGLAGDVAVKMAAEDLADEVSKADEVPF